MREYTGPTAEIHRVAFIPGSPSRIAAVVSTRVYLWDLDRSDSVAALASEEDAWGDPVLSVSPDGRWLVAGPAEHLRIWNVSVSEPDAHHPLRCSGQFLAEFVGRPDEMTIVGWLIHKNETLLLRTDLPVALSGGPRVSPVVPMRFDLTAELAEKVSKTNSAEARRYANLAADGSRFAFSGFHERAVTVWDARTGRRLGTIPLRGTTEALALSPDGSRIAIDGGTTVYVHDATTLELATKWKVKHSYVPHLAWSPDGRLLGRTDRSTTSRLYDAATGREVSALGMKRGLNTAIAFAPDGLTYAVGTREGVVRVWDMSE